MRLKRDTPIIHVPIKKYWACLSTPIYSRMSAFIAVCTYYLRQGIKKLLPTSRHPFLVDRTPYKLPVPVIKHLKVGEEELRERKLIVVGDVHGCYDELVELIDKVEGRDPGVCLVFVGDLINKGPKSVEVVRLVRQLQGYCVRGNHEEISLLVWQQYQEDSEPIPQKFSWLCDFTPEELDWLHSLPYTIEFTSRNITVVHAGCVPGVELHQQSLDNMLHMRDVTFDLKTLDYRSCKVPNAMCQPWAEVWSGPSHIYFGHDARRFLQLYDHATGLDTGCAYGGYLSAALPHLNNNIVQVKAHHTYKKTTKPYATPPNISTAPPRL